MMKCYDCGSTFEHCRVVYENRQAWDGSYDDTYVCPCCGSEDIGEEEDEDE